MQYHDLDGNGRVCLIVSFHGLHVRRQSKHPVMNWGGGGTRNISCWICMDLFRASVWKNLTFTVGRVEGLVSLDVNVARLQGHQRRFLQFDVWEASLQEDVLLQVGLQAEVRGGDLKANAN